MHGVSPVPRCTAEKGDVHPPWHPTTAKERSTRADDVEWQLNMTPDAPSVSVIGLGKTRPPATIWAQIAGLFVRGSAKSRPMPVAASLTGHDHSLL